jgi:hypothetical protein
VVPDYFPEPPSRSMFPLHRRFDQRIDPLPRVALMFFFPNETQSLQSTEAIVHRSRREVCVANQVLSGHSSPVLKHHIEKLRRRR